MCRLTPFGVWEGREVPCIELSDGEYAVELLPYGAAVRAIYVPDRNGDRRDICLGYDRLEEYRDRDACFGGTIGRCANRIGGARFTIDGKEYRVTANEGENCLHGGNEGFHRRLWDFVCTEDAVTFSYTSPDGEEGFPGTVHTEVTYRLTGGELSIEYRARTDRSTVVNLTNHAYFNLGGHDSGRVDGHVLTVRASRYTPTDSANVPTGKETWPIANSRVREFFPDMKIIGWYLNSTTISDMEIIKKAHKESFNEEDNIFFMINPKDNSPKLFMGSKGNLKALDGYTVYYEKNEEMQNYMTDVRKDHAEFSNEFSDESTGRYRQMLNEKRTASKSTKRNFTIIYGLSMFLLIVVLIIGVNNINSYDKMKDKTDGETKIAGSEDPTTKKNTPVESVNGDVETTPKQEEAETTTPAESPTTKPTEPETTTPAPTEAATTAAQYDTYTVKAGDSFISICKQFYGNENMADVGLIRDANNMGENDELLIGMEIKIPRK